MSVANSGALVAGIPSVKPMAIKITVTRPFMYERKAQAVGSTLEVSITFGHEMVACGKAEYYKEPVIVSEPEAEPEPTKRKRGASNVSG